MMIRWPPDDGIAGCCIQLQKGCCIQLQKKWPAGRANATKACQPAKNPEGAAYAAKGGSDRLAALNKWRLSAHESPHSVAPFRFDDSSASATLIPRLSPMACLGCYSIEARA